MALTHNTNVLVSNSIYILIKSKSIDIYILHSDVLLMKDNHSVYFSIDISNQLT